MVRVFFFIVIDVKFAVAGVVLAVELVVMRAVGYIVADDVGDAVDVGDMDDGALLVLIDVVSAGCGIIVFGRNAVGVDDNGTDAVRCTVDVFDFAAFE